MAAQIGLQGAEAEEFIREQQQMSRDQRQEEREEAERQRQEATLHEERKQEEAERQRQHEREMAALKIQNRRRNANEVDATSELLRSYLLFLWM